MDGVRQPGEAAARALAAHGVVAGGGDFYAVRPLRALGVDPAKGVLRVSFTHYTSAEEVGRLIRALDEVLQALSQARPRRARSGERDNPHRSVN